MKLFDLKGKKAIVTGGKNGNLGPLWVETLVSFGAEVTSFDLPSVNIADTYSVDISVGRYVELNGTPDIIVNNAAIDNPPGSNSTFFGNFSKILGVNLTGHVYLVEQFLPAMVKNGGGVVVNIGSIQGYGGADHRNYEGSFEKPCGYNLSKAALLNFSRCLTTQYGRYGIRSVTVSFGCVASDKIKKEFALKYLSGVPTGRMISKESLQMSLLYAVCCRDLTGVDWRVDGGLGSWA